MSEILESLRAIQAAAKDRHAALRAEMDELEGAFPALRPAAVTVSGSARRSRHSAEWRALMSARMRERMASPEARAAQSARMKARWADARANGATALQPTAH